MFNNIQYGFDPHDDSDFLNIHDNTVYNNGNHGIIASKRCASCAVVREYWYRSRQGHHSYLTKLFHPASSLTATPVPFPTTSEEV